MSGMNFLEKLLNGVEVEWVTLGSVANIGTGSSNRQDESENGVYPFYVRSKNILKSDSYEFDEVAIVIPGEGGIGDIFHYIEGKYALHQRAYRIHITSDNVSTKYLYHFMFSSFKQYILMKSVGATAVSIRKPMIEEFKIPIPCPDNPKKSLDIQAEIARILDAFTELTTELTTELIARKKQYAHYRDQLLSFDEGDVEWRALGKIGEFIRGSGMQKKDFVGVGFPAIHYGQIYTRYGLSADKTLIYVPEELANRLKIAQKNDLLLATTSENDEDVVKPLAWLGEQVAISGDMMIFRHEQNVKYLAYFFQTDTFQRQKIKYITGTKVRRVSSGDLAKILVPIPYSNDPEKSLAAQARIVAILDKFDALINSITEGLPLEIKLRQKQYEYYRDLLFSFPKTEKVS